MEQQDRPLKRGWTTGACATAAAKSAFHALATGEFLDPVEIALPGGQRPGFALATTLREQGAATAGVIKDAGDGTRWLLTGDIAKMDDDAFFSIVDRKKDMILVSGFNVYPTDIEQVLYRHPKVKKACVVGVPDPTTGEAVKAFVVLRDGQTTTAEEIIAFLRAEGSGLTAYKIPKQVVFRDSLPETLVGKVLRRVLLEEDGG